MNASYPAAVEFGHGYYIVRDSMMPMHKESVYGSPSMSMASGTSLSIDMQSEKSFRDRTPDGRIVVNRILKRLAIATPGMPRLFTLNTCTDHACPAGANNGR